MDITPLVRKGQQIIQSYAGGAFKISGKNYNSAVIVFGDETHDWDAPHTMDDLALAHFDTLIKISDEIDVLLLGCGAEMRFLDRDLRSDLKAGGLSIDVMDTGAACRTYNVLMAEGRRVVAALFPV